MTDCRPTDTPVILYGQVFEIDSLNKDDYNSYRGIIGSVLYLTVKTSPHIVILASKPGSVVSEPERYRLVPAKRVSRYLKGTKNFTIVLKAGDVDQLNAYADANCGVDESSSRKSLTGIL